MLNTPVAIKKLLVFHQDQSATAKETNTGLNHPPAYAEMRIDELPIIGRLAAAVTSYIKTYNLFQSLSGRSPLPRHAIPAIDTQLRNLEVRAL
jgi:hypothetical protein